MTDLVERLEAIGREYGSDRELLHVHADEILLEALKRLEEGAAVAIAWQKLQEQFGFWYA